MFYRISLFVAEDNLIGVFDFIRKLLDAEYVNHFNVEGRGFDIGLNRNDEFDFFKSKEFPDGFLYFPYSIEIDANESVTETDLVNTLNELLRFFWVSGYPGILSGDIEYLLVEKGGYNSLNVPWVY